MSQKKFKAGCGHMVAPGRVGEICGECFIETHRKLDNLMTAAKAAIVHLEACQLGKIHAPFRSASLPLLKSAIAAIQGPPKKDPEDDGVASWSPKPPRPNEPLTVVELMELLSEHDPEKMVIIAGCDCFGDAVDVGSLNEEEVLIERKDP